LRKTVISQLKGDIHKASESHTPSFPLSKESMLERKEDRLIRDIRLCPHFGFLMSKAHSPTKLTFVGKSIYAR